MGSSNDSHAFLACEPTQPSTHHNEQKYELEARYLLIIGKFDMKIA